MRTLFSLVFLLLSSTLHAQSPSGVEIRRIRAPKASSTGVGDRMITIVRVDPSKFDFLFLSEAEDGKRRGLQKWTKDRNLVGGTNGGMFLPNGKSVGFLKHRSKVRSKRKPTKFTGVFAFDESGKFAVGGNGCTDNLETLNQRFPSVIQTRRLMIGCDGKLQKWPNRKRYSVSAIGIDKKGWPVLIHIRTPYRMDEVSQMLIDLKLGIRGLAYLEGGPEASLVVRGKVREMGSWEDGFYRSDDNHVFWDLPNVIGFRRKIPLRKASK